jgi:hypothetical protein
VAGCAAGRATTTSPADVPGRIDLPWVGLSMPAPRGWVRHPDRTGSIGMLLIEHWSGPHAGKESSERIAIVAGASQLREDFDERLIVEAGPRIGGLPSQRLRVKPNTKELPMWGNDFSEGYRVAHAGMDFYLLHSARDPATASGTFSELINGIRWSDPLPAHRALAMSGRRDMLAEGLSYEIPDPFVCNPFRGQYYMTFSLFPEADDDDEFEGTYEIHPIPEARTTEAALERAAKMEAYYGTRIGSPLWKSISNSPHVCVTEMSSSDADLGQWPFHQKLIVARRPDGGFVRIGFFVTAPRDVADRYDELMNRVAASIRADASATTRRASTARASVSNPAR